MHLMTLRVGRWQFAPTLWPTLAALFFLLLTLWLGNWQQQKAQTQRDLQTRYDRAEQQAPIPVGQHPLDREAVLYRKLALRGVFDPAQTILIDNRVHDGVAGYHVLTPLLLAGSSMAVLVNRGWVAVGASREQLPVIPTPSGEVRIVGMAVDPHSRYLELGKVQRSGQVWQNLDFDAYAARYPKTLQPVLLQQTSETPDGLLRTWPRPDLKIDMHVSYAVQWYSLAATLVVLWLAVNIRRDRTHPADDEALPGGPPQD